MVVWASIWSARTAGEGGRGTWRASSRGRLGVRVGARAVVGSVSDLWVKKNLSLVFNLAWGDIGCEGTRRSVEVEEGTYAASSSSSRALMVWRRCLGFLSSGVVMDGLCLTGEEGSTPWKKGATLGSLESVLEFARRCSSSAVWRSAFASRWTLMVAGVLAGICIMLGGT